MIESLEDFETHFLHGYEADADIRRDIHRHAEASPSVIGKLRWAKVLRPSWYRRTTEQMIQKYALHVYQQIRDLEELEQLEAQLRASEAKLQQLEAQASAVPNQISAAAASRESSETELRAKKEMARESFEQSVVARADVKRENVAQAIQATDAKARSAELVEKQLLQTGLLRRDDTGAIAFDNTAIVKRLEELFLQELVKGIEDEDGKGQWLDRRVDSLAGSRSPVLGRIRSASELKHVDWVASTKYAQSRGLPVPCYPFLLARQPNEDHDRQSDCVNTAICIDTSPSMATNGRFDIAKKLAFALNALMRRINPGSELHLGHFNFNAHTTTAAELFKQVEPKNNTNTNFALDWLHDTLALQRPAVAYLITDGSPNCRESEWQEAAKRFADYEDLHLRIVLVDGDARAKNHIREMGKLAGPETKVIAVSYDEMAGEVLRNIVDTIEGIYAISDF